VIAGAAIFVGGTLCGEDGLIPPGRPPEWGIAAGYGIPFDVGPGDSREHQVVVSPSVGFGLTSRLELVAAATYERYLTPVGDFAGLLPLGARYTLLSGDWLPYAGLGVGFGWTDLEIEEISRRFNFRIEAAVGLRARVDGRSAWTLEVRYQHTSNAGTSFPNYGLNSIAFLAGWRFR
jgi:hypothetical protein